MKNNNCVTCIFNNVKPLPVLGASVTYLDVVRIPQARILVTCKVNKDEEHEYLYEIRCANPRQWTVKNQDTFTKHNTHNMNSKDEVLARFVNCKLGITRITLETSGVRHKDDRESVTLYYSD